MVMSDLSFQIALLSGLLCSLVVLATARGNICYECQRMSHPRDCDNVVQCHDGQVCMVERVVLSSSHFYFNSGCLQNASCPSHIVPIGRRKLTTQRLIGSLGRRSSSLYQGCAKCCDSDYCNINLCDPFPKIQCKRLDALRWESTHIRKSFIKLYWVSNDEVQENSTIKRCFSCPDVDYPSDCNTIIGCDLDEMCYTTYFLNTFRERRYRLGCMSITECAISASGPYGRKRENLPENRYCTECCVGHHCNRDACKNAPTVLPNTTKPTSAVLCEDNPGINCTNAILPYICPNPSFGQLCKKSCGFCGGGSGVVVPVTTSSPMTSLPPISGECRDSSNQSCTQEILPIICFDDVMKYFCKKSCRMCELLPIICFDDVMKYFCKKSCHMCGAAVTSTANPPVNTGTCVDNDIRCYNVSFLYTACWDSKERNLCPKSCGLCFL